jgi:hypothetical protein
VATVHVREEPETVRSRVRDKRVRCGRVASVKEKGVLFREKMRKGDEGVKMNEKHNPGQIFGVRWVKIGLPCD